jgi:hypothetical protein
MKVDEVEAACLRPELREKGAVSEFHRGLHPPDPVGGVRFLLRRPVGRAEDRDVVSKAGQPVGVGAGHISHPAPIGREG